MRGQSVTKSKSTGIRRRRRPALLSVLMLAILGAGTLLFLNETPTASYANASCAGRPFGGRWVNTGRIDGSDVMAATIALPCTATATHAASTDAAKIEISLTVRCLRILACDWQSVAAVPADSLNPTRLKAHYDQQNFDRTVSVEPVDATHLRLTLTSRFKGIGIGSVETVYTLERAQS